MYERFTERARKVMRLASQEARSFNHEYVGTEHILLGLVKEGEGVAAHVLKNLGVDLLEIRLEVEKSVESEAYQAGTHIPQAKRVIDYSLEEARNLGHSYAGTEHLLLAVMRQQKEMAAQILADRG